ncbi:MAG TPA: hypothetical protein ENG63_00955 [Candidatus Desulfofervidus auxilii]|uniref:Uncharacterized protein n=1 Tax=Desulfofervidus auxilii TaxID=1621989 RepID=A0A7C0U1E0_DESA2|nr:hypothetical protein [Candidatus Desulfofervidus auxilii]
MRKIISFFISVIFFVSFFVCVICAISLFLFSIFNHWFVNKLELLDLVLVATITYLVCILILLSGLLSKSEKKRKIRKTYNMDFYWR